VTEVIEPAAAAPLTEETAAALAAEAEAGYAPSELSEAPYRVTLPDQETSVVELRVPTRLARGQSAADFFASLPDSSDIDLPLPQRRVEPPRPVDFG
jgi:hypothetical protein